MDEDFVASVLAATFRGTNEEVKNATKELFLLFNNPDFPNLLFSLIPNQKYEIAIRKASVLVFRLILRGSMPPEILLSFCQKLSVVIESCEQDLSPILKECSNQMIDSLYRNSTDITNIIFQLLIQDHIKSSLFYANSFINLVNGFISNANSKVISEYKLFTSNYIHSLQEIFVSIFSNFELNETSIELISLIFNFLSVSTSYIFPEIFYDYSQLQFWLPVSMVSYDVIKCDEYKYLSFLSNLPKHLIKNGNDTDALLLINEIISWTCNNLNNYNYDDENIDLRCISMTFKIFYKLIKLNLFQFDEILFIELLQNYILPNFNYSNLIENNKASSLDCWLNLHDASLYLFKEIIENENQFLNVFYSLFESTQFIESDCFVPALDLYSFFVELFYQIDPSQFIIFLDQLQELLESSNEDSIKIVCLKIFSQFKNKRIDLSTEFLLNSISFSLSNIFNEESLVSYFAALASSSLITLIKNDENVSSQILENESIIERINDLFAIFFELERDYQTEMITASLMQIVIFFGQKIQPFLYQISNEVVEFFFNFASNRENHQPSILLSSILCKLIEISEGDPQFIAHLLKEILNEESWANINFPFAFDKLFEILATLIYYSTELLEDFCQIFPFLFEYLSENDNNSHLFGDISDIIEMLIWKNNQSESVVSREINSVLIEFLLQFLQSCDNLEEWIVAASLSIKIDSFSSMYEISLILPKLFDFLSLDPSDIFNPFVYNVVEHMFSFHSQTILTFDSEIVNFLFYDIYIKKAKYPSFVDSFLRSVDSLPIELKSISYQKAQSLIKKKIQSNEEEEEEEEYYEDNSENNIVKPKWFDENEILINFSAFSSQLEPDS